MKAKLSIWVLVLVLVMAVPASAAKPEPVGKRIDLFGWLYQTFPEEVSFHVAHGWDIDPSAGYPMGLFSFELVFNGSPIEADFVLSEVDPGAPAPLKRLWVHNFPDGYRGLALITGRWYAPCQAAVDYGIYQGQCSDQLEVVEAMVRMVFVEFTP